MSLQAVRLWSAAAVATHRHPGNCFAYYLMVVLHEKFVFLISLGVEVCDEVENLFLG